MNKKIIIVLMALVGLIVLFYFIFSGQSGQSIINGEFLHNSITQILKSEGLSVIEEEYSPTELKPCKGGYGGIDFGENEECETETIEILNNNGLKSWIALTYYPSSTPYTTNELNDNIKQLENYESEIKKDGEKSYIIATGIVKGQISPGSDWQNLTAKIYILNCQNKATVFYNYMEEKEDSTINMHNAPIIAEKILNLC